LSDGLLTWKGGSYPLNRMQRAPNAKGSDPLTFGRRGSGRNA
jgi:hypothetical protein